MLFKPPAFNCRWHTFGICLKSTSRALSTVTPSQFHGDFVLHPGVFSLSEQKVLLSASLEKLDRAESRQFRKRRKQFFESLPSPPLAASSVEELFLPDEYYDFQMGHYDGVIKNYREMHVTSWPDDIPELSHLLHRIGNFHPQEVTQTHLLHLASDGEIQPHVDHLTAFGAWIASVSLGADRILRLEKLGSDGSLPFDIILPSGSVYVQKDTVRYDYKHSVLEQGVVGGRKLQGGQRVSIMIRNRKQFQSL